MEIYGVQITRRYGIIENDSYMNVAFDKIENAWNYIGDRMTDFTNEFFTDNPFIKPLRIIIDKNCVIVPFNMLHSTRLNYIRYDIVPMFLT